MNRFSCRIMVVLVFCGCSAKSATPNAGASDSPASASSAVSIRKRSSSDPSTAVPQRLLGAGERRVALLVLPGDAVVEIDNVLARRRNGMVELVGKAGDERRVEVFLDAATKVEKIVKIDEAGVSPPLIDAEEETKDKSGPAKTPAVFDNDE